MTKPVKELFGAHRLQHGILVDKTTTMKELIAWFSPARNSRLEME